MHATNSNTDTKSKARLLPILTDTLFVLFALYFTLTYLHSLLAYAEAQSSFPVSQTIILVYQLTAIALMLVRRNAVAFSPDVRDYVYTLVGVGAPLFFRPVFEGPVYLAAECIEFLGALLVVAAFFSLNKSFGIAPENRGVKTAGTYRIVRHPMYSGYIVAEAGFVINNFSYFNLCVLAIAVSFLLLRLLAEERLLRNDPAYQAYSRRVRWKLFPYVF
jgi:protein-S-isoprenylcysteine O-methyltransferase Ste14